MLSNVLSAKEQELIQWITSMDSLKLVAYAGCAGIDEQTPLDHNDTSSTLPITWLHSRGLNYKDM